jgi:hypothetical protein
MRVSFRILAVFEGIIGAVIGFAISILASILRVIGGSVGISTDQSHFFLAIILSLLAFVGALLAIGPGVAAAICLLVASRGRLFQRSSCSRRPGLPLPAAALPRRRLSPLLSTSPWSRNRKHNPLSLRLHGSPPRSSRGHTTRSQRSLLRLSGLPGATSERTLKRPWVKRPQSKWRRMKRLALRRQLARSPRASRQRELAPWKPRSGQSRRSHRSPLDPSRSHSARRNAGRSRRRTPRCPGRRPERLQTGRHITTRRRADR